MRSLPLLIGILMTSSLGATMAHAGHEGGNGGGALVCPRGGLVSYDLAMAYLLNPGLSLPHTATAEALRKMDSLEKASLVLANVKSLLAPVQAFSPETAEAIAHEAGYFLEGDFIPGYRIPDLHDSYPAAINGCAFRYVARRHNAIWEADKDTVDQLDLASLTGLVLHEAVYATEKHAPDCQEPVKLTALLLAGALNQLNTIEAINRMSSKYLPYMFTLGEERGDPSHPETKRPIQIWPESVQYPFHAIHSRYVVDQVELSRSYHCAPAVPSKTSPSFTIKSLGDLAEIEFLPGADRGFWPRQPYYAQEQSNGRVRFEIQQGDGPYRTQNLWIPQISALAPEERDSLATFDATLIQEGDPAVQYICR